MLSVGYLTTGGPALFCGVRFVKVPREGLVITLVTPLMAQGWHIIKAVV